MTRLLAVVNLESPEREVLGEYRLTDEDAVSYWREDDGTIAWAPEDCVAVVPAVRARPGCPLRERPAAC